MSVRSRNSRVLDALDATRWNGAARRDALRGPGVLLVLTLVAVGIVLAVARHGASDTSRQAAPSPAAPVVGHITIATGQPGAFFPRGTVSLSTEAFELGQNDLNGRHRSLVNLLRRLGPGVLRVGGDTADTSFWASTSAERTPKWATVRITPHDLQNLRELLMKTGWSVVLAVDFGHLNVSRAAGEARAASRILGARLRGIEIGNEPNDYNLGSIDLRPGYFTWKEYFHEIGRYVSAIHAAVPAVSLWGPDTSALAWFQYIAEQRQPFDEYTEHYYPTQYAPHADGCQPTSVPTARELLGAKTRAAEASLAASLKSAGAALGRPVAVDETNDTAACGDAGGPDTSPVFASAIWAMNWALTAASGGVVMTNFHAEFGECGRFTFSPICAPDATAEASGQVVAKPEYFGLLAAAALEGGRFVPVTLTGQPSTRAVSAFATVTRKGLIKLAIINNGFDQGLKVSIAISGRASVQEAFLSAPKVLSLTDERFGPLIARDDSLLLGRRQPTLHVRDAVNVQLRAVRAVVLTITPTGVAASKAP